MTRKAYDTSEGRKQSDWIRQNKTRTHRIKEHIAGGHGIITYMTLWMNKCNHNRQDNIKQRTHRIKEHIKGGHDNIKLMTHRMMKAIQCVLVLFCLVQSDCVLPSHVSYAFYGNFHLFSSCIICAPSYYICLVHYVFFSFDVSYAS